MPFVMVRHNAPKDLLERFCAVFNKKVTRTVAKETYLAGVAEFRVSVMQKFGQHPFYSPDTDTFTNQTTAKNVAEELKMPTGTVSRYLLIIYSPISLDLRISF